jgi:hypothetical protein
MEDVIFAVNFMKLQEHWPRAIQNIENHVLITLRNLLFTWYILLNYGDLTPRKFETISQRFKKKGHKT